MRDIHVKASCGKLLLIAGFALAAMVGPAGADVITDWNQKAVPIVTKYSLGAPGYRDLAIMHLAMYQCVNSIEPRYEPYQTRLAAPATASKEAAAAVSAAVVLSKLHPEDQAKVDTELKQYLAQIPDGPAKDEGIALGQKVAEGVLTMRANDGSSAPDSYRPRTTAGRYIATAPVVVPMWGKVTPFALKSASQFRPGPPINLKSRVWAENYNEIKEIGAKNSTTRSAAQTETGRLWLYTGPGTFMPLAVRLSQAKGLSVNENARLFALLSMATADAMVAVFDAKYHYEFWRPITAIRNGDIDGNPQTERDASWDSLGPAPMHPEYPCAHCIVAGAAGTVMQSFFGTGTLPEFSLTTPTAPGVTHRWTRLEDYIEEPLNARIWSGIHYRFSTKVGTEMGRKIADYTVQNHLQPLK
jgi:hypothetical protein